jgi:hypothetical protein
MPPKVTIKQLHSTTGEHVRRAGAARVPTVITDRGKAVAVLSNPSLLRVRPRQRVTLVAYEALMARAPGKDLVEDLAVVRGER